MSAFLDDPIGFLNTFLWSYVLIAVLVPMGLWFTIATGLVQFRYFFRMFSILGEGFRHHDGQPTSFQALTLSVAGRVGAGNIAGVAVAITLGGPGAIFWMWVVGLVGMATSFVECTLAQTFKRTEPSGAFRGGPAFYIKRGLGKRLGAGATILAGLFTLLLFATFAIAFNVLQSFTMGSTLESAFNIPAEITGVVLALVVGVLMFGGVCRIASVTEYVVPVMAVGYLVLALIGISMNLEALPGVFSTIFNSAFGLDAAFGGGIGAAISQGVRRGLFSNEAGLGSAPNVAAVALVPHPADQGMVQSLSVFIDTLIMCTCTASIILLSGIEYNNPDVDGVALTQNALAMQLGPWAEYFVAIALTLFTFSSILYNYVLGENSIDYFFGEQKILFRLFGVGVMGLAYIGATSDLSSVFAFADVTMGFLALVNLFALALLFPTARRILRDFGDQLRAGKKVPTFEAERFPDLEIDARSWPADGTAGK